MNEPPLRDLVPAVQDALVEAMRVWPDDPPRDPKGWLVTVAWAEWSAVSMPLLQSLIPPMGIPKKTTA